MKRMVLSEANVLQLISDKRLHQIVPAFRILEARQHQRQRGCKCRKNTVNNRAQLVASARSIISNLPPQTLKRLKETVNVDEFVVYHQIGGRIKEVVF